MKAECNKNASLPITGKSVMLRIMTDEDTPLIVKWRNNPRVRDNFIYRKTFTHETHENWIRNYINSAKTVQFIICVRSEELRPVGSVYFRDIDKEKHSAEYGIFIGEDDATGKGFGNETAVLALTYAFMTMKMQIVRLRVFCRNTAALRSYERAGFEIVDTQKNVRSSDGSEGDMYIMECRADKYMTHINIRK